MNKVGSAIPAASNTVTWVQTERATHEAWGQLTIKSPRAAALAHFLVANMESSGAVVASYSTLAKMTGMSVSTIRRAIDDLKAGRWLEVVQIGGKGGANAFRINSRVAWSQSRDKLHLAAFTARVIADKSEQPALDDAPLRRIPTLMPGEFQLPSGPGEDPPSQPSFAGLEPDLPAVIDDAPRSLPEAIE
ncbi:TPA: helix-turn-helix domain-containing protein [Escherichia coli]|nr:helix-turn-helix domain-containing protein [Escherichia coli]HAN2301211.1 helix-turn-helix domain-containing protein [Escherichia coli]HBC1523843.1 helix-turn-helix domain-containing protein [Escherichia coli]